MDATSQFQAAATGNIFNLGGQHGVCLVGDHNITYQIVLADRAHLEALLAEIKQGTRKVEQVPEAVPLPTLVLQVATAAETTPPRWRLTCRHPAKGPEEAVQSTEIPNPRTHEFDVQLARFHQLAVTALPKAEERAGLSARALFLGETLTAIIPQVERESLAALGLAQGPPPFLVIESAEDAVLSLPWELLRLGDEWSVRDGRLDVARCVPNSHAAQLSPPTGPVSVYVNVCAPESGHGAGLNYEKESYRVTRALHDHPGVRVNEMGEVDDLIKVVCQDQPPTVIHFSGHGGQGSLLFEDEFGGGLKLSVGDLITRMKQEEVKAWPRLFYLACCHGQTPAAEGSQAGVSSTAACLHREGIPQVVAHFGPVFDSQSTDAESAFYSALAGGKRTRQAVREARIALAVPFEPLLREPQRREDGESQAGGQTPFAWALLALYHAGADYPLSLPITPTQADGPKNLVRRRDEEIHAGGRSKVLRAGFIGRRRDLHELRRRLRDGHNRLVVQGLGGLGKSVYCWKALALYAERRYQPLALWCAAVEDAPDRAEALLQQFIASVGPLAGAQWDDLVEDAARQFPSPAQRLGALLDMLLGQQQAPPLALYLDNLESLMRRPDRDDYQPDTIGEWHSEECRAVWRVLAALAARHPGRLALLASCRYRHPDFPRADLLPFPPMPDDTVFRMIEWFPALGRLSRWTQARLVPRLQGHPRAVEFLDGFVSDEIARWEKDQGEQTPAATEAEAEQEWQRLVEPVLEATQQKLREDLLFDALWQRVLGVPERRLLVQMTALRRPAEMEMALALADPNERGRDLQRLRDTGLIEEEVERDATGREIARRFEVHAVVAAFAKPLAMADWEPWRREGCRLAGDYLDRRLKAAQQLKVSDLLDVGNYLVAAGEADRGFEWLLSLTEWTAGRGHMAQALFSLGVILPTETRQVLSPQNRMRASVLVAGCLAGLGRLAQADPELRQAVALGEQLARQDPTNPPLQRDLSVSHNKVGDVQRAQGDLVGALASFRKSMEITEQLARQDPTNAAWQRDLSVSLDRLGDVQMAQGDLAGALASFRKDMEITEQLARQDPTNAERQRDVSTSHQRLGDVQLAQGDLVGALSSFRKDMEIAEQLARQDPTNAAWQRDLSSSRQKLGDVQLAQGDLAGALASFRESQQLVEQLARQDPTNAEWQRDLSASRMRLGDVQLTRGDLAGALLSFCKGMEVTQRLARQDPSNATWQRDLSASRMRLGDVQLAQSDLAGALVSFRKGMEITQRLARQDPTNAQWQADMVVSLVRISRATDPTTPEGRETARSALQRALAIAEKLAAEGRMTDHHQQAWVEDLRARLAVLS